MASAIFFQRPPRRRASKNPSLSARFPIFGFPLRAYPPRQVPVPKVRISSDATPPASSRPASPKFWYGAIVADSRFAMSFMLERTHPGSSSFLSRSSSARTGRRDGIHRLPPVRERGGGCADALRVLLQEPDADRSVSAASAVIVFIGASFDDCRPDPARAVGTSGTPLPCRFDPSTDRRASQASQLPGTFPSRSRPPRRRRDAAGQPSEQQLDYLSESNERCYHY